MSGHTPGPWKVRIGQKNNEKADGVFACIEGGPDEFVLCDVWADVDELEAEAPFNARLIAAAPDLLAACKRIIDAIDPQRDEFVTEAAFVEACEAIDAADLAIEKAEGAL